MSREDIHKLLGGYATGTLTETERQALFEAALDDPALFEALAEEQALKEMLEDPAARQRMLGALEPQPRWRRLAGWLVRPAGLAAAAATAALVVTISVGTVWQQRKAAGPVAQVGPAGQASTVAPAVEPAAPLVAQRAQAPAKPAAAPRTEPKSFTPPAQLADEARRESAPETLPPAPSSPAPAERDAAAPPVKSAAAPPPPPRAAPAPSPTAETVALEPLSGFLPQAQARFFATGGASQTAGVRYSLIRRSGAGAFEVVEPNTRLTADDVVKLRVESNQAGMVALAEGSHILYTAAIQPYRAIDLPPAGLSVAESDRNLQLAFTRAAAIGGVAGGALPRAALRKAEASPRAAANTAPADATPSADQAVASRSENAVYVLDSPSRPDARVIVNVRLRRR
ncbi:MAG: hypothetical protein HYS04_06175 [Acidobacteria bacterium]|nr:hypothetical protein [Acidobacteriota bacterium]